MITIYLLILSTILIYSGEGMSINDNDMEKWMHPLPKSIFQAEPPTEDSSFWKKDAQDRLMSKIQSSNIMETRKAKNILFYLGNGMSLSTVTAARIFKGQKVDKLVFGEEGELHMDTFPFTGISKTFCSDSQVADSACSATAFLCGTKANSGTIGVTPRVMLGDCLGQADPANRVSSLLAWAQTEGKSTGVVSTTRITHATPAAVWANIAHRDWENDGVIRSHGKDPELCSDIAKQLIISKPGSNIDVILGGGRLQFLPNTTMDPESCARGFRQDGMNLIENWISQNNPSNSKYVTGKKELLALDTSGCDKLLGLFSADHLAYLDKQEEDDDPSLEEMTKVAIQILSSNPNGFFLFVEGGRIDHGHHANLIQRALWETLEFDKAIKIGDELTNDDETLIVVTSDHAHAMTLAGYPPRGNPIHATSQSIASDGLPYVTLGYANGPSGLLWIDPVTGKRRDISEDSFDSLDYQTPAPIFMNSETHSGDDVLIFAKGPYAHLFSGVHQQSYIPFAVGYAGCLGDGVKSCGQGNSATKSISISLRFILNIKKFFPNCLLQKFIH